MRRRTPIFQAIDDALVSSGLQPDRHSLKKLLWESAANVIFSQGKVMRKKAASTAFDMIVDRPGEYGPNIEDFTTVQAPWVDSGGHSYSIDGSQGTEKDLNHLSLLEFGKKYRLSLDVAGLGAGDALVIWLGVTTANLTINADGTHSVVSPVIGDPNTAGYVYIRALAGTSANITNLSITEVLLDAVDDFTGPIRGLGQQQANTGSRWLWAGAAGVIKRWQFGAPEVIDYSFGTYVEDATLTERPTIYDFTVFGNWMIVNDSISPPYIHKPEAGTPWAPYAPLEAPIGAVRFMKKMNFMLAIGYGPRGTQVGWSDADNIEIFTADENNLAGSMAIDEFNTPIRAAAGLGDTIAVYAEDQMALVRYIGAPYVFGQKTVFDGIGAIGKAAVASDGRVNVGVSRAGCWWTDGVSNPRYIDEGFLADYLQNNVNWDQAAKTSVWRNDYTGCFEFHFPMLGSNVINEAWAWDPRTGGWSPVPAKSFGDERRLFGYPILGTNTGIVQLGDFDENNLGALTLSTKPLVMQVTESPHTNALVDELDVLLHKASEIEFRVGSSAEPNAPEDEWDWTEWEPVEVGAKIKELQRVPEAPFWKLQFRSTPDENTTWDIDLQGFLLYGEIVGTKV